MELTQIIQRYWPALSAQSGQPVSADQRSAVNAILGCGTGQYGSVRLACRDCGDTTELLPTM